MRREADRLAISDRVLTPGGVYGRAALEHYYEYAVAALSPGCVGLSIVQAGAFGLPMLYASDEPHGPELEAAEEGFNALSVDSDDPSALARAMVGIAADAQIWSQRRDEISRRVRERYSVEAMADGFVNALVGG